MNKFNFTKVIGRYFSSCISLKQKYSFQDIDAIIKDLKEMRISLDSLPYELKIFQNEITQILIIPTLDEESCCGSNCTPCVRESAVENEERYTTNIEKLLEKLNQRSIRI
jgi:hypothetical protein